MVTASKVSINAQHVFSASPKVLPGAAPAIYHVALPAIDRVQFGSLHPSPATELKPAFPEIEPYKTHRMKVSDTHELYVEECGNPNGYPVVVLHGGPGGGSSPILRRMLDPQFYRIIQFDQRGCGKSTPSINEDLQAGLKDNTTWDLVEDTEKIRKALNIEKWGVMGGSWGSTLALAYAETHPEKVSGLILRGAFLCRKDDIASFYEERGVARYIWPDAWKDFVAPVPPEKRGNMVQAYHELLNSPDEQTRLKAAKAWSVWEATCIRLKPDHEMIEEFNDPKYALPFATIENHYFTNGGFFKTDNQLIEDAHKIRHIPTWIVDGRYDTVCPVKQAVDLADALPNAKLTIVPDAGHATKEPGITSGLVEAGEELKAKLSEQPAVSAEEAAEQKSWRKKLVQVVRLLGFDGTVTV